MARSGTTSRTKRRGHEHGAGNLTLRGGKWLARWSDANGNRHSRTTGESDRAKAEEKLREFTSEARTATIEAAAERAQIQYKGRIEEERAFLAKREAEAPALAIADAWQAYLDCADRPDTGEATLAMYACQFNRFKAWLSGYDTEERKTGKDGKAKLSKRHTKGYNEAVTELREVDGATAAAFLKTLAATRSANTFNKYIVFFRHFWKTLYKAAKLTCNPWEDFKKKHELTHARRELTVDELARVIEAEARTRLEAKTKQREFRGA